MSTSSNHSKVLTISGVEDLPNTTNKIKYLWQDLNLIRTVRGKIHSSKSLALKSGDLLMGNQKVFSIPFKTHFSRPILKLQFTGTTSVVTPDMWALACIEKIEIKHGWKIGEYSGEDLSKLFMHYAPGENEKSLIYTQCGGNGATLTATTYTAIIPIWDFLSHPSALWGNKFISPFYTGLMPNQFEFYITFKSAANTFKTPDTVTSFTTCDMYYMNYDGDNLELEMAKTSYQKFMYDIKTYRQKKTFVSGTEQAVDISSVSNDNTQIHDQIFQIVSDTNWTTNKNYNQGENPTSYRLNVNGIDWYKSSNAAETLDAIADYRMKYGKQPYFSASATSYMWLTDVYLHEKADNYSSTLDETIMTPSVKMTNLSPTLYITMGSSADFWVCLTCVRQRVVNFDGSFATEKFQ